MHLARLERGLGNRRSNITSKLDRIGHSYGDKEHSDSTEVSSLRLCRVFSVQVPRESFFGKKGQRCPGSPDYWMLYGTKPNID